MEYSKACEYSDRPREYSEPTEGPHCLEINDAHLLFSLGPRMVAAGTRRVAAVVEYDGLEVDPSEVGP